MNRINRDVKINKSRGSTHRWNSPPHNPLRSGIISQNKEVSLFESRLSSTWKKTIIRRTKLKYLFASIRKIYCHPNYGNNASQVNFLKPVIHVQLTALITGTVQLYSNWNNSMIIVYIMELFQRHSYEITVTPRKCTTLVFWGKSQTGFLEAVRNIFSRVFSLYWRY